MKTKELIAALQKVDPTGDMEVAVGNLPIWFVSKEPAYYDGCLQILYRDEGNQPSLGIITSEGEKIVINTHSVREAVYDNPDLEIQLIGAYANQSYGLQVEHWRRDVNQIYKRK